MGIGGGKAFAAGCGISVIDATIKANGQPAMRTHVFNPWTITISFPPFDAARSLFPSEDMRKAGASDTSGPCLFSPLNRPSAPVGVVAEWGVRGRSKRRAASAARHVANQGELR